MSPTIRHKYKYIHSTVQRPKDRRQKFHFCRLPFDVRPRNVNLNLSIKRSDFLVKIRGGPWTWSIDQVHGWSMDRGPWEWSMDPGPCFVNVPKGGSFEPLETPSTPPPSPTGLEYLIARLCQLCYNILSPNGESCNA